MALKQYVPTFLQFLKENAGYEETSTVATPTAQIPAKQELDEAAAVSAKAKAALDSLDLEKPSSLDDAKFIEALADKFPNDKFQLDTAFAKKSPRLAKFSKIFSSEKFAICIPSADQVSVLGTVKSEAQFPAVVVEKGKEGNLPTSFDEAFFKGSKDADGISVKTMEKLFTGGSLS